MAGRVLLQALLPRSTMATATFFTADVASQAITHGSNEQSLSSLSSDSSTTISSLTSLRPFDSLDSISDSLDSFSSEWDLSRSAKSAAFGLSIVSWYGFSTTFVLSKVLPTCTKRGITLSMALLQSSAQQALFAPPLTFSILYSSAAVLHGDETAFETAKEQLPGVGATAWSFLPWVNGLVNWGVRSPGWKKAALATVSTGWATYLALVATPG
ncbi:hypothetical protein BJ741DRAFT_703467 [Chytriomyces cf. hyalinus JEL632]|nr:hypothetical protein BJ741DRAFT_703467 [Chytriomyces cf. hyalinus JEL632]